VPAFVKDGSVIHESLWWQHEGNRALRVANWKIVAAGATAEWELYDLKTDRGESNDLAAAEPKRVRDLAQIWTKHFNEFFKMAGQDVPPGPSQK
jgi:arylsulfatase